MLEEPAASFFVAYDELIDKLVAYLLRAIDRGPAGDLLGAPLRAELPPDPSFSLRANSSSPFFHSGPVSSVPLFLRPVTTILEECTLAVSLKFSRDRGLMKTS
jgi:hypothetical protein